MFASHRVYGENQRLFLYKKLNVKEINWWFYVFLRDYRKHIYIYIYIYILTDMYSGNNVVKCLYKYFKNYYPCQVVMHMT